MSKAKTYVAPMDGQPAPLPYGVVTGAGVDDYDGNFKEYTAVIELTKAQAKQVREVAMEFWEENAPKNAGSKPTNWGKFIREDDGVYKFYLRTRTKFTDDDGKSTSTRIPLVDGSKTPLDPEKYGQFGTGSMGFVSFSLSIYKSGKKYGISKYLKAVQLTAYAPPSSGNGVDAFGDAGGFEEVKPKKKKGKKKKK